MKVDGARAALSIGNTDEVARAAITTASEQSGKVLEAFGEQLKQALNDFQDIVEKEREREEAYRKEYAENEAKIAANAPAIKRASVLFALEEIPEGLGIITRNEVRLILSRIISWYKIEQGLRPWRAKFSDLTNNPIASYNDVEFDELIRMGLTLLTRQKQT